MRLHDIADFRYGLQDALLQFSRGDAGRHGVDDFFCHFSSSIGTLALDPNPKGQVIGIVLFLHYPPTPWHGPLPAFSGHWKNRTTFSSKPSNTLFFHDLTQIGCLFQVDQVNLVRDGRLFDFKACQRQFLRHFICCFDRDVDIRMGRRRASGSGSEKPDFRLRKLSTQIGFQIFDRLHGSIIPSVI